jgi:2,3-bisphosphoglycerate-dependent phosphoglycerate mutase
LPLAIFMRHGQAENNVNRILVGRNIEAHLTEYGKEQANDTAIHLKRLPIEKVYVSPVLRTIETARIVCSVLGMDYEIDERLFEIDLGKLAGMNYEDIIQKYGNLFLQFYSEADSTLTDSFGVEEFRAVKSRIRSLLDEIAEVHTEKNVLMITHLDPIKAAISMLLDLKPEALYNWHIRNASLTILKQEAKIYYLYGVNIMGMHRYVNE